MAPKHYTPEQLAHLDEMNAPDYQYNPGWETDHIAWVPYAEVVKDMQENSEEYHPGMLKLFHNSKDAIERALKIEPKPEKQGAVKVAWKEIAIEENDPKAKDPLKGNLLGGVLESDADLKAWAEHEIDLPPKRERQRLNFVKKFHGKRMAVIDDLRVFDRGKGWGTKIVSNFIEQAKAANCDGIILQAGTFEEQQKGFDLVDWYGRLGFKTLGHSGELPLMVKWLKVQGKTSANKNCPSGKKKFFDEVSAIGPQKHWDKGTPNLRAYKCPLCGWWHLTSKPQWTDEQRKLHNKSGEQTHMFPNSQDAKFRQWFNGSKVVDKAGNPMPVYHGTRSSVEFDEFSVDGPPQIEDSEGESTSSGSGADPTAFMGAHFAEEANVANQFAQGEGWQKSRYDGPNEKPRVIQVFLRITNPKDFGSEHNLREFINQGKISDDDATNIVMENRDDIHYWEPEQEQAAQEWDEKYDSDQAFRTEANRYLWEQHSTGPEYEGEQGNL